MARSQFTLAAQVERSKLRNFRILRFLVVGGATSLGYVIAVAVLVDGIGHSEGLAAGIAYLLMLPASFFGHKLFTYQSKQRTLPASIRFVAVHGITAAICAGVMWIINAHLGATHWFGSATIVVIAPAINFILMEIWVFAKEKE